MNTSQIVAEVKQEISRLESVVALLEPQPSEPLSVSTKPAKKGHVWSQAQRNTMSKKLRASWAKRQRKSK